MAPDFKILNSLSLVFSVAYKIKPVKGFLSYEYNPLLCMRSSEDKYLIENTTGRYLDLNSQPIIVNGKYITTQNISELSESDYKSIEPADPGEAPKSGHLYIKNYANELIDFRTKKLNLDINHPVDIECQPSYDGSVNLILTDDLNTPKLINSRFSVTENNQYQVVDRAGNNDTNI